MNYSNNRFLKNESGGTAVAFAMTSLLLLGSGAIAVDYTQLYNHKDNLQQLVDAAALAGTSELSVANITSDQIKSLSTEFVRAGLSPAENRQVSLQVKVDKATQSGNSVTVSASYTWQPIFAQLFSQNVTPVYVSARAVSANSQNVCVIGLNSTDSGTISLTSNARITANGCAVFSNSKKSDGFFAYNGSQVQSTQNCSSGGYQGPVGNFSPLPITDCPPTLDPLAHRSAPDTSGCDHNNRGIHRQTITINPGVYCGGLSIGTGSNVTMNPGVYVIKDGRLEVTNSSTLSGTGVGFYLTGSNATFLFTSNATIKLDAPTSGPLAGLLFFEDRNNPTGRVHEILGERIRNLVGTVYLPRGTFFVSSREPVADQSAYTAVIANKVVIGREAKLVLNTDYHETDVPVPEGLVGNSGSRLVE